MNTQRRNEADSSTPRHRSSTGEFVRRDRPRRNAPRRYSIEALEERVLLAAPHNPAFDVIQLYKASGSNYIPCGSAALDLMVMSYFGRVAERSSRASIAFISRAGTRTPSGYSPSSRFTVGCRPFHLIRKAHCRTTFQQFSSTPFHFLSSADQHRSIELYLL